MKERPIIFSAPMVRAIIDGRKTQTRRIVNPQPPKPEAVRKISGDNFGLFTDAHSSSAAEFRVSGPVWAVRELCGKTEWLCPYGKPGDRLWVRENGWERPFRTRRMMREGADTWQPYEYDAADCDHEQLKEWRWKRRPSIFMPRWATRITLEIIWVGLERLQFISEEDAISEGSQIPINQLPRSCQQGCLTERTQFARIWNSINGKKHPWESNPWVWVIEFRRAL